MSDCRSNCPIPSGGYCERHRCQKTAHWVALCHRPQGDYWALWESGRGPGQGSRQVKTKPIAKGWGDRLHDWLSARGITEQQYIALKVRFGLPPKCGCQARREWLNRVEAWVKGQRAN